jgi:hypothetical protein
MLSHLQSHLHCLFLLESILNHISQSPLAWHIMTLDRTLCTLATCSVEQYGWYSYIPNVGANAAFLVVFAVLAIIQLYLAIRYRVWGAFAGGLMAGCVTEAIGYAGRVLQGHGDGIFEKK